MKNIFNASENNAIIERINHMSPDVKPVWGKMNSAQMLAHCQVQLHVAFGDIKLKRNLMGILFGSFIKKKLTGMDDLRKNLPTDKAFIITGNRNFSEEKSKLIKLVQRLAEEGPEIISKEPHPFFGSLTIDQWDILIYKHLDHHLKQFDA